MATVSFVDLAENNWEAVEDIPIGESPVVVAFEDGTTTDEGDDSGWYQKYLSTWVPPENYEDSDFDGGIDITKVNAPRGLLQITFAFFGIF